MSLNEKNIRFLSILHPFSCGMYRVYTLSIQLFNGTIFSCFIWLDLLSDLTKSVPLFSVFHLYISIVLDDGFCEVFPESGYIQS